MSFLESPLFVWGIVPLLIFLARVIDVSLGTLRIVYIARGKTLLAPVLGFFEIIVWLIAIRQIFAHLDNVAYFLAYAAGFAMGNYVGMVIEQKLAVGMQVVRIIIHNGTQNLRNSMKEAGFSYTMLEGQGVNNIVKVVFTVIRRKDFPLLYEMINRHNPNAFYTQEDLQNARDTFIPSMSQKNNNFAWHLLKMDRKRK